MDQVAESIARINGMTDSQFRVLHNLAVYHGHGWGVAIPEGTPRAATPPITAALRAYEEEQRSPPLMPGGLFPSDLVPGAGGAFAHHTCGNTMWRVDRDGGGRVVRDVGGHRVSTTAYAADDRWHVPGTITVAVTPVAAVRSGAPLFTVELSGDVSAATANDVERLAECVSIGWFAPGSGREHAATLVRSVVLRALSRAGVTVQA